MRENRWETEQRLKRWSYYNNKIKKRSITYTPFDGFIYGLSYSSHIKGWIKSGIKTEKKTVMHKRAFVRYMVYII